MRSCVFALIVLGAVSCLAQQPDVQQIVTREFGSSFTVVPAFPPIMADIDNDGAEDMIVVVTSKTPLADEAAFHYRAIDPYDSFWGYGNPRDTVQFAATDAGPTRYLAIIHNWHSPKAKFLIVNLPFDKLAISRVQYKKKAITSIHAAEAGGLESDVFWDGKKYRWEPGYINN